MASSMADVPQPQAAAGGPLRRKRVAVLGAGWTGLQLAQSLRESGVSEVTIFEKWDGVGGTWHPRGAYDSQEVHASVWHAEFKDFHYCDSQKVRDGKASATAVNAYQRRFVKHHGLDARIQLNSTVVEVRYCSATETAALVVVDSITGEERVAGPFDLVVFASITANPTVPKIENRGFRGEVLHSRDLKTEAVTRFIRDKKRVAIVGAGKSGCDANLVFQSRGYEDTVWVQRTPYFHFKYELIFHERQWYRRIQGFIALIGLLMFRLWPSFAMWFLCLTGHAVRLPGPVHWNASKFHFSVLDQKQLESLKRIEAVFGEPDYLSEDGLHMTDGAVVPADAVVYCTGYSGGLEDLRLVKDGRALELDRRAPLFEHMIPPDFPCLLIAAASPFNFGPYKGVNTAEYIVHHLCRGRVSEEAMKQSAARLVFKQDAFRLGLFQSDSPWAQSWVKFFEDQWRLGYLSVGDFVSFGVRFFVNARPSSIRMSYSSLSKQRSESCGSALPVGVNGGC